MGWKIFVQAIGYCGTTANVLSQQFKKNLHYYIAQFAGGVFFIIHFALLGGWGGCLLNAVAVLRMIAMLGGDRFHNKFVLGGLLGLFTGATALIIVMGWDSPFALFALAAQILGTLGIWSRDPMTIRKAQLFFVSPGWIVYDILTGSLGGITCEAINIVSTLIFFLRMRSEANKTEKANKT